MSGGAALVGRLRVEAPALRLDLQIMTSDVLISGLRDATLDIGIGRPADRHDLQGLRFEPLLPEDLAVVASSQHPLARADTLSMVDPVEAQWVLQPRSSPMRVPLDQMFAQRAMPVPVHRLGTASSLVTAVMLEDSDLLAVLPLSTARYFARHSLLCILPVELPKILGQYGLLHQDRSDGQHSVALAAAMIRNLVTAPH